jgi:hypothetical protein
MSNGSKSVSVLTTWLLIATSSALAQVPTVPAPRFHHSGVYDEARKEFLIYGGFTYDQKIQKLGDLWGWNGSTWKLVGDSGVRKIVAPLAFDSKRQLTLMFGGTGDSDVNDGKLRRLEGGTWQLIKDAPYLARDDVSLAYDSQRDRLVLFGGRNGEVLFADTWEFDGSDWKPTFMAGPSLRSGGPAVYDSARSVTVLYGAAKQ